MPQFPQYVSSARRTRTGDRGSRIYYFPHRFISHVWSLGVAQHLFRDGRTLIKILDPKKTREREALLKRMCELDREIAENERELWEIKKREVARLAVEEQLAFYLKQILSHTKNPAWEHVTCQVMT